MLRQFGKSGVELPTSAADNLCIQAYRISFTHRMKSLEKTTVYLFCFSQWCVTVIKRNGEGSIRSESLSIVLDKTLNVYNSCF